MKEISKNQEKSFFNFKKSLITSLLSLSIAVPMSLGVVACTTPVVKGNESSHPQLINKNFLAYYRAWRDVKMHGVNTDLDDQNWITMNDIPYGINIVNIFSYVPAGQEEKAQPFFDALQTDYGPNLRARGIKLIRGFSYSDLFMMNEQDAKDFKYSDISNARKANNPDWKYDYQGDFPTADQITEFTNALFDRLMNINGFKLDGVDIDMEDYPDQHEIAVTDAVITEMSKSIGPKSGNKDSIFLYDTNGPYPEPFEHVADSFDLLAYQQYGSPSARTEMAIANYENYLNPDKFMPGLTFPEELDGNDWVDTDEDYQKSNFYDVASFVHQNNLGGMFVYALDRDGRNYDQGEDGDWKHIRPSNFLWTKTAILESNGVTLKTARDLALHHLDRIQYHLGLTPTMIEVIKKEIKAAKTLLDINAVIMGRDYPRTAAWSPTYDPILENNLLLNIDLTPAHEAMKKANELIDGGKVDAHIKTAKTNLAELMAGKQYSVQELKDAVNNLNQFLK